MYQDLNCRLNQKFEQHHRQALVMITDAYLFHLVRLHRRPVYRHLYGDISLNQPAVQGFIDTYLADKGWTVDRRLRRYMRILDLTAYTERQNTDFIDWGSVPSLKPRGIRWLNACFSRLGEMVNAQGGWKEAEANVSNRRKTDEV